MRKLLVVVLLATSLMGDIFSQGSVSIGAKLGGASIGNEDYTIVGVSGNYFVIDDLSVGLGYEKWFSGDPDIDKITVEGTYFFHLNEQFHPYAGLLIRRILISGNDRFGRSFDDTNAYGYRAGVAFTQDRLLISAGIVQEKYDTTQGFFDDTETYLEVVVGFTF